METRKRGRPKKPDAKRSTFELRVEAELLARLRKRAQAEGMSASEFVRQLIGAALGPPPR